MKDKKKIAAALAAVVNYIKTGEEGGTMYGVFAQPDPAPAPIRSWGISGRQAQMQLRNLMQFKALHRLR
ncbi:MAG: hypothetical protein J7K30_05010 [Deltaproteobacteria bacterium]|nr:hypothetical protein [Deltaproteobacteria bacterium]